MNDTHRQVAALGLVAALVAAALYFGAADGSRQPAPGPFVELEAGTDHVAPDQLAAELMAARGDVVLVDVRPADEFAAWHLPGSVNLTVPALLGAAGDELFARAPRLVVLCSNGTTHPGQAWVELRARGHTNVRVLEGGLEQFKSEVLTPPSLRGQLDEATAKAAAVPFALTRAFLLGDPRPSALQTWATDPERLERPTVVSARWVHERLGALALVDARERAADHLALHLPGAVHLPVATLRERAHGTELFLLPPDQLAARFGALGITHTTPVVIYAEDKMQDATLAVLAFLRTGHRAVAILEGGLLRWATERRPLVAGAVVVAPATYVPQPADDFTIGVDELAARVQGGDARVLDVRPPEFFRGEKSTEARPGHIPGSVNRPFTKDLTHTADGHWWRPRAELEAEYAALGITADEPVVVSCRTGHQASESFFVLRWLLGREDVRWYNGSWTEWAARSDLPAATGSPAR